MRWRITPWLLGIWSHTPGRLQGWIEWLLLPKFLVGVMAVVLDSTGGVLLFRHTYRTRYPWGIPGGWLRAGEDPTEGVEREVREESGLRIRAVHPLVIGGDKALRRLDLMYLCELDGGTFRASSEVSEAGFFALDALPGPVEPFHIQVADYARGVAAGKLATQPQQGVCCPSHRRV
jgi:8-oxo-dGTP diphosphatase